MVINARPMARIWLAADRCDRKAAPFAERGKRSEAYRSTLPLVGRHRALLPRSLHG